MTNNNTRTVYNRFTLTLIFNGFMQSYSIVEVDGLIFYISKISVFNKVGFLRYILNTCQNLIWELVYYDTLSTEWISKCHMWSRNYLPFQSTRGFSVIRDVDRCLSFCLLCFCFGYVVVCLSSIYGFWLPI